MAESHGYPDPHGYTPNGRRCEESDCPLCRDAGLGWKSGFCFSGRWSPKPVATAPLDPQVWSKLPREILGNIFTRLPTDGIGRVRCLSKEWRMATSSSSKFTQECAKFQPDLWAMIGFHDGPAKTCWARAYDNQACKWHAFEIESIPQLYRNAIRVFDGGLGCFVPCGLGEDHQPILVCNPLTREWRQLPLSRLVGNQPRMAQLRVDGDRGTYKVIVVGHVGVAPDLKNRWEENNPLAAEVYDSETKEWSALVSGKVLGFTYWWCTRSPIPKSMRLGVYDCSLGVLCEYYEQEFPRRPYQNSDGEVRGNWEDPSFANHTNDLYLLEYYLDLYYQHHVKAGFLFYNVLKHEEGNWGLGPNGSAQGRTAPNEIIELELWKCDPGSLRVCKSFFLVIGNHVDREPDCERIYYLSLYDRENKKWLEEFEFEDFPPRPDVINVPGVYDCAHFVLREYDGFEFPVRPYWNADGEFGGHWGCPQLVNHVNDLYLVEDVLHDEYDEKHCVKIEYSSYNLLKHEEGSWGFGRSSGHPFVRVTPNEILDFIWWRCGPARLLVCKSFFLMIGHEFNHQYDQMFYMRLYDRENKKWLREVFEFDSRDSRHSVSSNDMCQLGIGELWWDVCP